MKGVRNWPTADWDATTRTLRALYGIGRPLNWRGLRLTASGVDNFPRAGGVVVASNHWSWWDPILVMAATPRPVGWIAKKELFEGAFGSRFFRAVGCIPVDRHARGANEAAYREALAALASGRVVGIFPEGTRSAPGALLPPKHGVARLALGSRAPVVPVAVRSAGFWGKGKRWPDVREEVSVAIGEPVAYDYGPDATADRALVAKVAEDVMARIQRLLDDAPSAAP